MRLDLVYDVRLRRPRRPCLQANLPNQAGRRSLRRRPADRSGPWGLDRPRKSATTFAELAPRWLNGNSAKRPTSLERDEAIIRLNLLPELGSRAVGSITPADVQRVVNGWAQHYAPRTVHRHYDVLSAIMTTAVLGLRQAECAGLRVPDRLPPRHAHHRRAAHPGPARLDGHRRTQIRRRTADPVRPADDLRRANATGLVAEGVDVRTAQARLGHADPRLTLAIYAQATGDADRSAAARIGARFIKPKGPTAGSAKNHPAS